MKKSRRQDGEVKDCEYLRAPRMWEAHMVNLDIIQEILSAS